MKKQMVWDATLRVQCEVQKKALSFRERLNIAQRLEKAGVDAIVLPALTGGREDAVVCRTIAQSAHCGVCISGGDTPETVAAAWECVQVAEKPCIQIVLPISTVQMEYQYHLKGEKMLEKIASLCRAASALCSEVMFVARDATRAEAGFAAACCRTAAENGATAVMLCDDGSVAFPGELAALVREVKNACTAAVCVRPGNGLSLAAACAVEAILAGADGVETAAGDSDSLSADCLAHILRAKGNQLLAQCSLDVTAIDDLLSGVSAGPEKTAVAAAPVETVALEEGSSIAEVAAAVTALGYELTDEELGNVHREFCRVSRRKKAIGAQELEAIVATAAMQVPSTYHLTSYVINSGNIITATAHITLEKNGESISGVSVGDGPIDAAFHAIEQILGHHYELDDFQVQAVTKGREAVGSALIRLRAEGKLYSGNGISTDVVGACIRAYINALNKIVYEGK